MDICLLLHFYQPANQQDDILLRVVNECYLPLTRGLLKQTRAKVVVNINGALTKLLVDKGHVEVVENLQKLLASGSIVCTGSAMYHAFLPLLPESEIERQIELNYQTNKKLLGDKYEPVGFFAPEMAVNDKVLKIIRKAGYTWLACPEQSFAEGVAQTNVLYTDSTGELSYLFRNKRVSSLILSAECRDVDTLLIETQDLIDQEKYWFCVMDAETFGHHRIGHEKMLFDILTRPQLQSVFPEEIFSKLADKKAIELRPSTWSNSEQDFWLDQEKTQASEARSFILWKDPTNPIHLLQWELANLVTAAVQNYADKNTSNYAKARELLDSAISSDQFWWASTKPWWSLEMIEQGAFELKTVVNTLDAKSQQALKAEELYRAIIDQAFEWQRSGEIRKKHLENSSTYLRQPLKARTPSEWFNQLMLEFEHEMNKCAERKDFERAIKWRDAMIKIQIETDKFDVLHVVDELWSARNIPSLKPFLQFRWDEFSDFVKGYLVNQDGNPLSQSDFAAWQRQEV
jgi:hypothetical protein